ncbi:MAG: sodium:solute symporter family transporter [Planctomycetota bacterium]
MLSMQVNIGRIDLVVILVYLVGIVGLGCWAGFRQRRGAEGKAYFLAGGTLTWPIIGLALFSTNISTIHLVSQAQEGYMNGLTYGNFEWMAPFTLIALSLFFAPFYIRSKVATLPDFLEKRYSRPCRDWLALVSIVSAIFIHIGFSLYTGALVLEGLFGIPILYSIICVSVLTGLYTIIGGLMAVVVTESIQTVILLIGAICITVIGYSQVGGWEGMQDSVEPVKLTMLRSADDPSNLPWYSVFLGYPVIGLWYWCADQTIVQRVLGAKDENHARMGPLFAGFIKILPVFIFVMPGLICLGLINQGNLTSLPVEPTSGASESRVELSESEQQVYQAVLSNGTGEAKKATLEKIASETGFDKDAVHKTTQGLIDKKLLRVRSEDTYAHMITKLLPIGLRGVVAAALLAALMGTVSGALNSIATLFSYDIYKRWHPGISDHKLVIIGRVATFVAMVAAILWSPYISHFESIYQGANKLICYIAPPITVVFLWGVFWRRASAQGAISTLMVGLLLGAVVFFVDWNRDKAWLQQYIKWDVPFMMAAFYLFLACSVVLVVVSYFKPAPASAEIDAVVWKNPLESLRGKGWKGIGNYRIWAGALFFVMVALYIIFA